METSVIDEIYLNPIDILYDLYKKIEKKELASDYAVSVDPSNIHKDDEETPLPHSRPFVCLSWLKTYALRLYTAEVFHSIYK
jgi:hypothetical protein